jgi:HAD superfamily hydrolase (TIGR01490 family)
VTADRPARSTSGDRGATDARAAAFFDLDKTVIARSSSFAFGRPFYRGGLINRAAVLRSAYAQFVYVVGGMDHDQMERTRAQLQELVTGWPVDQLRDIVAETVHELIDPMIYSEALTLIREHHEAGRDVVIVSTSGSEVVDPIGAMLGADHVVATQMVTEEGRFTGEIAFYAYGANKAAAMRRLAGEQGYDLARSYAYSDSITDVPMLEEVGYPHAVNPDRALRAEANSRGWPILDFATPIGLRRRTADPRTRRVALATVGAAAVAGVVWYAGRRIGRGVGGTADAAGVR